MGASGAASMAQQRPGDAAKAAKPKPKKARRAAPYALVQPSDTLRQVGALQHSLQGVCQIAPCRPFRCCILERLACTLIQIPRITRTILHGHLRT